MTDKQEPVAWKHDCAGLCTNDVELWIDACPHCGKPRAAPPAQPADIGNTISSKTPEPNEENPYVLWREIHRLRTEVQGPSGFATWQDAAVAERVRRVKAEQELRAAQPAPAQEPQWINVADRMPNPGVVVLAFHKNSAGHGRRIRAAWVPAKTEEAHSESDFGEYDEETDCYYTPEGWYEQMEHWPEYTSCMVCGVEVTHWMPLPPQPKASHDPR